MRITFYENVFNSNVGARHHVPVKISLSYHTAMENPMCFQEICEFLGDLHHLTPRFCSLSSVYGPFHYPTLLTSMLFPYLQTPPRIFVCVAAFSKVLERC